ncbi:hypothetical protein N9Z72_00195 [Akkermansiaceae bacterium]|nr:hypothetical protein [Akkermansiaceae bacterium]
MKKRDIIQLVKETVKENTFYGNREQPSQLSTGTKVSVPTDEYPFSKKPKRTATGMMEAGPSNNPYYNNLVKKAKEMGIHVNDLMKDLLKDKSEMEIAKMGYQDLAALAGVENLSEFKQPKSFDPDTISLLRPMLNVADIHHNELVGGYDEVSSYLDKRTGGTIIKFPHFNGPQGRGALFGKETSDQIDSSKAKAKAAALKTYTQFKQYIEDYEISDASPAGVYGNMYLWIMFNDLAKDYTAPKGGTQSSQFEEIDEAPMFRTGIKQDMAPKEMAGRIKDVFNKVNGAKDPVKTPEWHKNRFKNKYGISFPETLKGINKDQALAMNKYANDMKITEADTKTYAGVDSVTSMKKDPRYGTLSGDAKVDLEKKLKDGGAVELEEEDLEEIGMFHDPLGYEPEDLRLEPEDMDDPDEDLVIIGSGYLDIKSNFKGRPNMTNGELAMIGQKVVDKLHKGDKEAALDYIYSKINEGEFTNDMGKDKFVDDEGRHAKMQLQKAAEYSIKLAKMMDDMTQLPSWVQSKITKASDYMSAVYHYLDYEMTNSQDNLMENVDKYKKRAVLMEGAMKKFFEMFDQGKTDEEIVQDYAQKGTTVPEPFVTKARRQYEGMKKLKLELEMSEKEFRNSSEKMVNNAEEGMEYEGEEKTLASGLTNEQPNEGNAFGLAMQKAKEAGDDSFELDGETFKVKK